LRGAECDRDCCDREMKGTGGRTPPSARIRHPLYCSYGMSSGHERGNDFGHDFTGAPAGS
jgi:hypothetical protein